MKNCFTFLFTFFCLTITVGQNNPLITDNTISLPKDSLVAKQLVTSLNDLLIAKEKPNDENNNVLISERIETYILLDEMNGIEKSGKYKDDNFYKPYLTNVVKLNDNEYYIQLSYIGIYENKPMLRASFELIAHKTAHSFLFSSLLLRNTKDWKTEKVGNNIFHYKQTINKVKTKEFNKLTASFDLKLKSTQKITEYYCTDNIIEMQKLIGVDYKSDYNGRKESVWSSSFGDRKLYVLGNNSSTFNDFDPHDTWHNSLYSVASRSKINRPIDEGCAYIYGGGSWGISWKDVFAKFKDKVASNANTDWAVCKEKPLNFNTPEIYLYADYVVNALLIRKIEKEKGFAGVWEFLNCGKLEKGNENYYKSLEKLTGITKANYNDKVWELIKMSK
ncbi:hypothetical protein IA01_01240 [Flavobacterium psychrophilum]|uniref:Uncharacterized protein n=2 Tax=Flavobacterium psychrophilum TaxID=96345 RepID=A6GW96_FLAPJ|nr:hypothetical protein [Flavobacterium psychrophilum]AIG29179.1 hypothetical protein IA03_01180 [Flavobacterium psychrophilum]AIG31456.1 hypothetical protein IA01_01240 [Flavobacterium psychrophilum]AIG33613.1 hypothetical protein IA02_00615 [Flavobacterium psychrophilum]AIG35980.1 hypothetical protein IA04_01165 [Flavobacterium psychrophilum]AIG38236.1 hypothetical protein IA05_01175 [Flavobacterium psychrophilum]